MRTTIDAAGRLVIPKKLRDQAGFAPGMELEVRYCNGRVEVEPAAATVRLERRGRFRVAVSDAPALPMSVEDVNAIIEEIRNERERDALGL